MTEQRHQGRRVLISGGTSGIGLASARRFLDDGASVCILGSSSETVESALVQLDDGKAFGYAGDVSAEDEVSRIFESLDSRFDGKIDVAFVNAGIDGEGVPAYEIATAHLMRVLDVNVVGAFLVSGMAVKRMGKGGRLIFNSSVNALRAESGFADYNASKAAVASLAQTMALELSDQGISSLAICPGYVLTRMTAPFIEDPKEAPKLLADIPVGRFTTPEEVADLVSYLATEASGYMTGSLIPFDGGRSI